MSEISRAIHKRPTSLLSAKLVPADYSLLIKGFRGQI